MAPLNADERREIFREELHKLVKANYVTLNLAARIINAHAKYYTTIPKVEQQRPAVQQKTPIEQQQPINQQKSQEPQLNQSIKENKSQVRQQLDPVSQEQETSSGLAPRPVMAPKQKDPLTAQQVRERNITWALNLGVILLLLGGLVLATSTWETLGNWTKTGLISLVSVLFFGLAWLTNRVLHIKKTALAFLILGSLFLPIVIVSAGYFELFGTYLSFSGEGKYLFGAIGTLVVLPIYIFFAFRLASRLFVWFSYVFISVFIGLLIAALYLPVDGFYLGIMLYNGLLILGYRGVRENPNLKVFTKEFIPFIQANLILSTLLMLVFYDHELMYSANLLLTAIIYFSMIYVTNHKSYHFVFTAMLVYGAYQLIENSMLAGVEEIAYAFLGIIFILIPRMIKDTKSLQTVFHVTSAIVSSLAFLYISFEGIILRINDPSIVLVIAYIIIALNFTYLVKSVTNTLFTYLSPIFFISALYELAMLGKDWIGYETVTLPFFVLAFSFYILVGCLVGGSFLGAIKQSSRDISGIAMLLSLLIGLSQTNAIEQSIMLLLVSILSIVTHRYEPRAAFKLFTTWIHAVALALAITALYSELVVTMDSLFVMSPFNQEGVILGSIVVLIISYVWKALRQTKFANHSFFIAQMFYGLGILISLAMETDSIVKVFISLGGIGMAYLLYKRTDWSAIPYVISGLSLLFYLNILVAMHTELANIPAAFEWFEFIIGAILLLGTGIIIGKKDEQLMKAYQWVGQIYLPHALMISLLINGEDAIWSFIIATIVYALSVKYVKSDWTIITFLYAGFTTFWVILLLLFIKLDLYDEIPYTFLISSIAMAIGWIISDEGWRKRIAYYLIPFSNIGILSFLTIYPYELEMFIPTLIYAIFVLYLFHRLAWDSFSIFTLLMIFAAVISYSDQFDEHFQLVAYAFFGILLTLLGMVLYQSMYLFAKNILRIDWYSILAFIVFVSLYEFSSFNSLYKVLPGILIVLFLFLQRNRLTGLSPRWVTFGAFTYLLQPYYALLGDVNLPDLFEREFYVLPWIIVVIVLRSFVWKENKQATNSIQWAVLVIVSLLLVQDGLASNTIYDALIVGVLSLASLVAGMIYQIKSFFFVGTGVLLFNVFMQTRPYWGKLPWWVYLLIAGSILITIASYNEWQKQRSSEGRETLVSKFKKNVIERIKKWD
ncbi:hypothetical protein [Ornithinibacillus xuwenensis]|uniref:DUF2157 domain-containing protein n=1 Tax=Ornithinibacillus xuwenensis TaxID=3144668 RepID=A0ABU9XHU2_9BACI